MNSETHSSDRNRIFVSLLLAMAGFVDLITWCLTEQRVAGFIVNYFVLGVLFVLQNAFRGVRYLLIALLILWVSYWLIINLNTANMLTLTKFFTSWFSNPSVLPLTLALGIITFLSWKFARNYDFTNG